MALRTDGRPLEPEIRTEMEARFGTELDDVRVHDDAHAATAARAIGASAYTSGPHIAFASGQYQPMSARGRGVLAHELTHVLQQRLDTGGGGLTLRGAPGATHEAEASRVSAVVAAGGRAPRIASSLAPGLVARLADDAADHPSSPGPAGHQATPEPAQLTDGAESRRDGSLEGLAGAPDTKTAGGVAPPDSELVWDVDELFQALNVMRNRDITLELLSKHHHHIERVDDLYRRRHDGRSLTTDFANLGDPDFLRALRYYEYGHLRDADKVFFALHGFGTDQETLFRILPDIRTKGPDMEFARTYYWRYSTDGKLLDGQTSRMAGAINNESLLGLAEKDKALALLTFGTLNTVDDVRFAEHRLWRDQDSALAALAKMTAAERATAPGDYKKRWGEDLHAVLGRLLSYDQLQRANVLLDTGSKDDQRLIQTVKLAITQVWVKPDRDVIFAAVERATPDAKTALKAEIDRAVAAQPSGQLVGIRDFLGGLNDADFGRLSAMLGRVEQGPELADPTVTLLRGKGGVDKSSVLTQLKLATKAELPVYAAGWKDREHPRFNQYVLGRINLDDIPVVETVLLGTLDQRIDYALEDGDDDYLMHLLTEFTDDDVKRRLSQSIGEFQHKVLDKRSTGVLNKVLMLLRPAHMTPAEAAHWYQAAIGREKSWVDDAADLNAARARDDELLELQAFARDLGHGTGELNDEQKAEFDERIERMKAALSDYLSVRDRWEEAAEQAAQLAVGFLTAPLTGGVSLEAAIADIVMAVGRAALTNAFFKVATRKLVKGDRFQVMGEEGIQTFATGAFEGAMNVFAPGVAEKMVEHGLGTVGVEAMRLTAAGGVRKAALEWGTKLTEGAVTGVASATVDNITKSETWKEGFADGLEKVATEGMGGALTGMRDAAGLHVLGKATAGAGKLLGMGHEPGGPGGHEVKGTERIAPEAAEPMGEGALPPKEGVRATAGPEAEAGRASTERKEDVAGGAGPGLDLGPNRPQGVASPSEGAQDHAAPVGGAAEIRGTPGAAVTPGPPVKPEPTGWPMAGPSGEQVRLSYRESGALRYEAGPHPKEHPFATMSDSEIEAAVSGVDRLAGGAKDSNARVGEYQRLKPDLFEPAFNEGRPGPYRDPFEPPGEWGYGYEGSPETGKFHGAMGRSREVTEGSRVGRRVFDPADIFGVTPNHTTYAVRGGPGGRFVDHIFNTLDEALAYAKFMSETRTVPQIRSESAIRPDWNVLDAYRVFEIPPETPFLRSGIGPQPEFPEGGGAPHVYPGGAQQVQIPGGMITTETKSLASFPIKQAPEPEAGHETLPPLEGPAPPQLRTNLSNADLAARGMPESAVTKFKEFVEGYGLIVDVRPTNPDALRRLQSGEALPKPEVLKQKTINDLDVILGIDARYIGLVGHIDPSQLKVPAEGSVVKHPVTGENLTVDQALHKQLSERRDRRAEEFDEKGSIGKKMKALVDEGGFSIEPPGIIRFGEGANAKPFTGDHDLFDFRYADDQTMTPEAYRYYVQTFREWGMNVEHGAHLHWITNDPEKLKIAVKHAAGGEPLIRFGQGDHAIEVYWDGVLDAQATLAPSSDVVTPGGTFAAPGLARHAGTRPVGPTQFHPDVLAGDNPVAHEFLGAAYKYPPIDFNAPLPAPAFDSAGKRIPDVVEAGIKSVDVSKPDRYHSRESMGDADEHGNRLFRYGFMASRDPEGTMQMDVTLRRAEPTSPSGAARSSMRGAAEFDAAFEHLNATPPGVRKIHSEFGDGDNLAAFSARYKALISAKVPPKKAKLEAARDTVSAKWAKSKKFVELRVDLEASNDGTVAWAAVDYYRKGEAPPEHDD